MNGRKEMCDPATPLKKVTIGMRKQNELIFNKEQVRQDHHGAKCLVHNVDHSGQDTKSEMGVKSEDLIRLRYLLPSCVTYSKSHNLPSLLPQYGSIYLARLLERLKDTLCECIL